VTGGSNVTVTLQVIAGGSATVPRQVPPVTRNGPPVVVAESGEVLATPTFEAVKNLSTPAPTMTDPKSYGAGVTESCAPVGVRPVSAALAPPPPAAVTFNNAYFSPGVSGEKRTLTEHVCEGASAAAHVVETT
jgi:hypothetical protein